MVTYKNNRDGDTEMLKIGTEVLGYWGAMHAYDDGVVVGTDEKFLHIKWGEAESVQLVEHADIKGQWYKNACCGVGIYDATL